MQSIAEEFFCPESSLLPRSHEADANRRRKVYAVDLLKHTVRIDGKDGDTVTVLIPD